MTRVLVWIEVVQVRTSELHDGFTAKQEISWKLNSCRLLDIDLWR